MPNTSSLKPKSKSSGSSGSSHAPAAGKKGEKAGESAGKKSAGGKGAAQGITNYATALKWLYNHVDYERLRLVSYNTRTFSLDRMRKLLSLLGNPHEELRCVHIAGTKGKGSTCAMLAHTLQSCGMTVGLFTSPHLVDLRERIVINGQMISHAELIEMLKSIAALEDKFGDNPPTFFEILTAVALRYYADQAVDIVILETGMGGRLDSTNVITPLVSGITHISLDHMNILGKDLASIAREKAGIFKKGVAAVSVEQDPAVARVLEEVATASNAPLEFTGKQIDFSYRFEANRELGPHTRVCLTTPTSRWEHLPVPLKGEHQAHNCGLALAILDKLKAHGFVIPEDKVIAGLAGTTLHGRMEQVWNEPRVIIDGAHNAHSITALIRALGAHIQYDSLVLIFGCGQDKDVLGMLKQLALGADKIIFTRAKANPRAVEPEELMSKFNDVSGKMAQVANGLEDALQLANRAVSREDLIVITGSFYLAGEAKKHFAEQAAKKRNSSSRSHSASHH
ncbi:MAG: bifunctional folylpolyglutamate synthase/dihydrofolate synthase [Planctomycetota bacterium]|nr:bifunctional folylpolyglutamate synthase/dihydrofolate synthase [Planctomycetota bacterium]